MPTFEAWTKAQAVRFMAYRKNAKSKLQIVNVHLVDAVADKNGCCSPKAHKTVCGQVDLKDLVPVNGQCYDERGMREFACLLGRGFCGQCAATLYADEV